MIKEKMNSQKGQSLVIVALFLVALIAILALTFDGGNAYLKRREAQNSADAGALAGARVYCEDPEANYGNAINTAIDYVNKNNASILPGYPTIYDDQVTVATTITFDTFFGNILGRPQITANAIAQAGCYSPCFGEGVLPIVWTCSTDDNPSPGLVNCDDLPITQAQLNLYEQPNPPAPCVPEPISGGYICPQLTIIKDTIDVDDLIVCADPGVDPIPDGEADCDLDNDGKNDWISAENRGWSDLDGNEDFSCELDESGAEGGPVELPNWIEHGYKCGLFPDTWVGDAPGDPKPNYDAVRDFAVDEFNILPVFSVVPAPCEGDPWVSSNGCSYHEYDEIHRFTSSAGQTKYYHIERFSVFYVTCVHYKNGDCPAASKFSNETDEINKNSYRAIEGYFINDYQPGLFGKCEYNKNGGLTVYLDK